MRAPSPRLWPIVPALGVTIVLVSFALIRTKTRPSTPNGSPRVDTSALRSGTSIDFRLGPYRVEVSVPDGEGATFGTFQVAIPSLSYDSGPIERDGSLETVWLSDVNNDGELDGVFVIRNGGSGSYVDIMVLKSAQCGFSLRRLPSISGATVPGYEGHDTVRIRNGVIFRSFPTYTHRRGIRLDQQWKPQQGLQGRAPLKSQPDSNARPSGASVDLRFNCAQGRWEQY